MATGAVDGGEPAGGGASDRPATGVFVGRTGELARLRAALEEAARTGARLLLLAGEAGSGKTALTARFLAGLDGGRFALASGDEDESLLPYGVVEQLATRLAPLRANLPGGGRPPADADPFDVGAAVVQALGATGSPLVLAVDDAHWADAPSMKALSFAFRRLDREPVLLVVAARTQEAARHLDTFHRLSAGERGTAVHLPGLTRPEVAALAAAVGVDGLPARALDRLIEHTAGNPLHIRALLREVRPEILAAASGPLPAPQSFRHLAIERLHRCSRPARALVEGAAVLGQQAPVTLAATVGAAGGDRDRTAGDRLVALDEAVGAGLLAQPAGATAVAFTHPLVRAAVYHDLGPARRAELHLRAASVVGGTAALEHRAAACQGFDDGLADDLVEVAAEEAAGGAWAPAAAHLRTASRLAARPQRRDDLLLASAEVLLAAGEAAELGALKPELESLPPSPRRDVVTGHLALLAGDPAAEEIMARAWERCDTAASPALAATIAAQLGQLAVNHADGESAVMWARRALEAADGDDAVADTAPSLLLIGLALAGRTDEGLALARDLPDDMTSPGAVEWRFGRGALRTWSDDLLGGIADMTAATDARRAWRAYRSRITGLGHLAEATYRAGAWDDSIAHATLALSLGVDTDNVWLAAFLHAQATYALAGRGRWEEAQRHASTALAAADALGVEAATAFAATAAAHLALARGDAAGVVEATDRIVPIAGRDGIREPGVLLWHAIRADALVTLGRDADADDELGDFEALARERGRCSAMADAARVRGNMAAARGDQAAAEAAFEQGLAHMGHGPWLFQRALLHDAYGRALRRAGQRRAAAGQLEAALSLYTGMGAAPYVERVHEELAACGRRRPRPEPGPSAELTPQELTVARLVAQGLSNRDIATQLVLSVKTVEYHLHNMFLKLGVRSRTQLAVRLVDGDDAATGDS